MNKLANQIKALGFRVFVRDGGDTYAYFTDGKSFGYIQQDRFGDCSVSSVHKPNQITGTGFRIHNSLNVLTQSNLSSAFCYGPEWMTRRDRESIKKYESEEAFLKAHSWGGGLKEY